MRLRNIPRAEGTIQAHHTVIRRPEDQRGCWRQVFGNKNPLSIEIGMGKGKFILDMAKRYPDVNFVGIDPWPKARHAKRRLTSSEFLERYEKILVDGGILEFKTDNTQLFNFSLEQLKESGWVIQNFTYDLHHHEEMNRDNIMTEYEEKFSGKGNPINKLIAVRKRNSIDVSPEEV